MTTVALNLRDETGAIVPINVVDGSLSTALVATPTIDIGDVTLLPGSANIGDVDIASITGVVSTANSTTTPLGIGGVFTGTAEDIKDYVTVNVALKSDVASATNGLSFQFSSDGTNWDVVETHTLPAGTGMAHLSRAKARYFRVVYTNGGTAQAYFRLATTFKSVGVSMTFEQLSIAINDNHDAALVRSVLAAKKPNNDYVNIQATAGGNLKVSLEEAEAGVAVGIDQTTPGTTNGVQVLDAAAVTVPTQIIKTVAATGTPEALAADATYFRTALIGALKAARTANVGIVYLGIGATNDTQPFALNSGEWLTINAPVGQKYDLNDWVLDVLNAGDGVAVIYS